MIYAVSVMVLALFIYIWVENRNIHRTLDEFEKHMDEYDEY